MSGDAKQGGPGPGEFLVYVGEDGVSKVHVRLVEGTVWLTQKQLAELFGKDVRTVNEHLQNIYEEGELDPAATLRKFRIVQMEGTREVARLVEHYCLPAILAVGYRVRSTQGTRFRQWATSLLDEYLVKGFVLDDARLQSAASLGEDYFDELLERIREIRASERRFYQKLTDIYAQCSVDYDAQSDITQTFYATVQNKLHWAIHGHTAAELIRERADASQPHMGLATWKHAPEGPIRKADVTVAKNYLTEPELRELSRVVTMYLDYAEDQARRRRPMTMESWVAKLDGFLQFNERDVLSHAGQVSHELATAHAESEFDRYRENQRKLESNLPTSDFDRAVEKTKQLESRTGGRGKKP
ncbi:MULTISPECIES: virulence RhuM family protein [Myxococcus]|uniref:Virulence RhuM family protein n=1 Tax=Myxococcus llanfairpwllgwyngyllgogerychwyrndrobwllllantysiliogogogochensis TaxID=2590453 RepID=A0A540X4B5_9BACT|nr:MULTISPECIES: virulence RhuM family protein [Myxococcus]NTX07629.1 virulence RhuM family protein [Myxococcus sp. CA040A]TQF15544.1 virulence RhuM family protein [Myxococcus llanfairpwllgwyngyllgogerychwyrndrobwllllantysiliogogogochensis]